MKYSYGVYAYLDNQGDVVYIGKDKDIDKGTRRREHLKPSKVKDQLINQMLDGNENEYEYVMLCTCINKEIMDMMENMLINEYKPQYNVRAKGVEKERNE